MRRAPTTADSLERRDHDDVVVLEGVTWADFQRFLEIRGERPVPRFAYLEGRLEIMSPSRSHESIKSMIGRLVEAWCMDKGVDITPYGSWTLADANVARGLEPDECYVVGDVDDPKRPDLAIEVVWTRAGVDKLEIYRGLRVREVWIWKRGAIEVHALNEEGYALAETSLVLPGIDLDELLGFVDVRPMTRAVREYRAVLHGA